MKTSSNDRALLDAILEAAVDAIILSDEKGRIIRGNAAARRLFQYKEEELVGRSVNMLMPEALANLHDGFMQHYIETGEKRIIGIGRDVEGRRKDGTVFPLHLSVGNADFEGGRTFIAILHDLTQRKAAEEALARSQRLDAVGQMTGGIAHDFNNLLTVIIGNLELAEMRLGGDGPTSLISDALSAAEMGAELTSRLMVFARRSNLKPLKVDLRVLCEDALAILKRTLGSEIEVKTKYTPQLRLVLVDPVQLQSTLVNLAINARDAMAGKGELLISIEDVSIDDSYMAQEIDVEPGDYVRLSVSDDGEGMDEEAQRRAFEPFYTTKGEGSGTGLGLAMVYGFVRQSGGHITLYSEKGLGTSFGLYFPALHERSEVAQIEVDAPNVETEAVGAGRSVLVVEDNPKVRKLSVSRLEALGFSVAQAASGQEAYDILKAGTEVDIVFSDVVMPGEMNGYDLAEKIAAEFPTARVLLTSGYASDVVARRHSTTTHHDVLHKPYRQAQLVARLQALLADGPED